MSYIDTLRDITFNVYSNQVLSEGVECFGTYEKMNGNNFYITSVKAKNIVTKNGKFYYTEEDLNSVSDFWPAHIINLTSNFKPSKKKKVGIKSNKCIVDVSGLPAFNKLAVTTNEDITVNDYRFFITLFNNFTVKQCRYDRYNLYDAKFKSSKYDLVSKMQNSDFLKSKDFTMININRSKDENVPIGIVIKESDNSMLNTGIEYGIVYLNMNNQLSIIWC